MLWISLTIITFLNKAGVTLSCRGSKKILTRYTWKSLEFNLDLESITLCLVPQLKHEADDCLVFASYNMDLMDLTGEGSTFLFFIFLVCCMLGEAKVPS
jgi:hypothetical protein